MARPQKKGLDYFPHDCGIPDEKLDLIEAEFGLTGYAIIFKLYEKIYSEEGYYCNWNKEVALMFAYKKQVGVNVVSEIIEAAKRRGIFDIDLYNKYKILTSAEIQEIYFEAVARRKQVDVIEDYLLVDCANFSVNVNINRINDNINSKNANNSTQSKVKKRKVNKSKVNENRVVLQLPCTNGTYDVTSEQVELLQQTYKNIDVMQSFRKMLDYINCHPKFQRSVSAMENRITVWLDQDNAKALSEQKQIPNSKNNKSDSTSYDINVFDKYDIFE